MAQQNSNESQSQQPSIVIVKEVKEEKTNFGWGTLLLACGVGFLFGQVMAEDEKKTQQTQMPAQIPSTQPINWQFWK